MVLGMFFVIYLDDFLVCGKSRDEVATHLNAIHIFCSELEVPLAKDKMVGPAVTHISEN